MVEPIEKPPTLEPRDPNKKPLVFPKPVHDKIEADAYEHFKKTLEGNSTLKRYLASAINEFRNQHEKKPYDSLEEMSVENLVGIMSDIYRDELKRMREKEQPRPDAAKHKNSRKDRHTVPRRNRAGQ